MEEVGYNINTVHTEDIERKHLKNWQTAILEGQQLKYRQIIPKFSRKFNGDFKII